MRSNLLIAVMLIAGLAGAGFLAYRALLGDAPLTIVAEQPRDGGYSAPADPAAALVPPAALAEILGRYRDDLERDPGAPVLGNPDGDVTIVEFFDYNCPYCKRIAGDLKQLIAEDRGVRLVSREWPILGEDSLFATQIALAAWRQGKYAEIHDALMAQRHVTAQSTVDAVKAIGLDLARLRADIDHPMVSRHISQSMELARRLGIIGTPTLVIGDTLSRGAISLDQLRQLVAQARAAQADKAAK